MTTKYFNVKQGITTGNILLDGITGNITANNANLGNVLTANFFVGAGNNLSNIAGANVTGQVGNALVAGTVYTNAQPNITSVGTLTSLSVTGTISGGNLTTTGYANAGSLNVTGLSNLGNVGNVTITGGSTDQYLKTDGAGNLTWSGISAGSSIINGTSNVAIPVTNGNVNLTAGGNTSLVVTDVGANVVGTLGVTGNLIAGNITTVGSAGNITGANVISANTFISNVTTGTAPFIVNSTTQVANLNVATSGTAVAVTGNAQGNITSVGTLTSLAVTGNIVGANVTANSYVFAPAIVQNASTYDTRISLSSAAGIIEANAGGNATQFLPGGSMRLPSAGASDILGGTFDGSKLTLNNDDAILSQSRGGNVKIQVGSGGTIANTWTFAQNGSFTAPGLVNAVGNINGANLTTGGVLSVTGNANVGNLGTTNLIATGTGSFGGNVNMNNFNITNLATPNASSDAATKQYVDDVAQGLNIHDSALAATTNNLATLTGGTITYNNGTGGVGANLVLTGSPTSNFLSANVFDGNVTAVVTSRILVKSETNQAYNGVYVVDSSTVLTRAADYNTVPEVEAGDFIFVQDGTTYNDTGWVQTSVVAVIGTDPIIFTQFSGAGTYTAGTGLTLTGTQFSISNTAVTAASYGSGDAVATFTVNGQGQLTAASNVAIAANAGNLTGTTLNAGIVTSSLTSVGTLGNLSVSFDITSGNVFANSGTIGAANLTGTLTTAAQPNITSVGTLSTLSVTGTVTGGNLITTGDANVGTLKVTGTSTLGNVGNVKITGGSTNQYLKTDGAGNLTWDTITVSGLANGTSNVAIPTVNGNVNLTAGGNTSFVVTDTGANVSGTLTATSNVTGSQLVSTVSTGTAPLVVTSTTQVANLNAATAGNALVAGTVYTNAQPNITSVGSLTGLTVSNATGIVDFTTTANVTLGAVGNLHISGGNVSEYLRTDGSGNLSWAVIEESSISNGNSNVNIPVANGNVIITAVGNTTMTITGTGANISGYANVSGNVDAAYFIGNGIAISNSSGANVSGTVANATYAVSAGTAGTVTTNAQPNITSVGTLTSLDVTGNISGGNISTLGTANVGTLIVTGNTSFGNITTNYVSLNGGITSNRSNVNVTTNTVIDQFAPTTFRTAKYVISASGDDGYQSVETLLIHDGTTAYITIYGSICSNNTADIIELSSNINGVSGNVALYATGTSANLKVNMVSSYIKT